jgi:hypothetical protein
VNENDLLKPILSDLRAFQKLKQKDIDMITEDVRKLSETKTLYLSNAIEGLRQQHDDVQRKIDRLMDLLIDASITKEDYDKKHKELREKQYDLGMQLDDHTKADESYHIAASTVLSLAKRAAEIFESSEPEEKNIFLNYLLQNPTVNGKTLGYALRSPFNAILELANCPSGGAVMDRFRTCLAG